MEQHYHWHRQHYQRQQWQQHRRHRQLLLLMSTVIHALHQARVAPATRVQLRAMVVSSLASAIRNRGQRSAHQ
ncbi:unnamed protein product [Rotaria magnacalcarata]|uniref:Uncharacterized protein n=1 Tax=Rotaria magnacalcarata TaxID=392030 RepID=A0A819ZWU2_9BILA|nr:unnamed protein product [Rotaria magnacalcarata]CAF2121169.1 unnamed protein product [Rotaria magnacalcarata]CAF4125065.1 unnamed protein product [Rotaria magnacalcarata]CAF4168486.1 unnamed protein product [Rotaria magnacalcarata]